MYALLGAKRHVVAQIIEAVFVVGAVGDIGGIGLAFFLAVLTRNNDTHAHAQKPVYLTHPFGVAARQVVVDGHHVHAFAGKGVQIHGERGHERLAFTGAHLRDLALVQHHSTDQLHVEMTHAQRALGHLAHASEGFMQQAVQAFAIRHAGFELGGLGAQLLVGELGELGLERIDARHILLHALEQTRVTTAEYLGKRFRNHKNPCASRGGVSKERQLWRKSGET